MKNNQIRNTTNKRTEQVDKLLAPVIAYLQSLRSKEFKAVIDGKGEFTFSERVLEEIDAMTYSADKSFYMKNNTFELEVDYDVTVESALYATRCISYEDQWAIEVDGIEDDDVPRFGGGKQKTILKLFHLNTPKVKELKYSELLKEYENRNLLLDPLGALALSGAYPHLQEIRAYECHWQDALENMFQLYFEHSSLDGRSLAGGYNGESETIHIRPSSLLVGRVVL